MKHVQVLVLVSREHYVWVEQGLTFSSTCWSSLRQSSQPISWLVQNTQN